MYACRRLDASGAAQRAAAGAACAHDLLTSSLLHCHHHRAPPPQWENLLHLDTIKARSKPLQPPKKPEAAPFFLPSVPGLSGQPSFTAAASDGAADGGAADGTAGIGSAGAGAGSSGGSRVLGTRRSGGGAAVVAAPSAFVALLRASGTAGDFASFVAQLRTLSPAAVDLELRSMVVLEGAVNDAAVNDIGLLLEALSAELAAGRNFELVQALLARMLEVGVVCACVARTAANMPGSGMACTHSQSLAIYGIHAAHAAERDPPAATTSAPAPAPAAAPLGARRHSGGTRQPGGRRRAAVSKAASGMVATGRAIAWRSLHAGLCQRRARLRPELGGSGGCSKHADFFAATLASAALFFFVKL
jgi:Utp21 specific WD40 associated putative domain